MLKDQVQQAFTGDYGPTYAEAEQFINDLTDELQKLGFEKGMAGKKGNCFTHTSRKTGIGIDHILSLVTANLMYPENNKQYYSEGPAVRLVIRTGGGFAPSKKENDVSLYIGEAITSEYEVPAYEKAGNSNDNPELLAYFSQNKYLTLDQKWENREAIVQSMGVFLVQNADPAIAEKLLPPRSAAAPSLKA
jgi:hypothetical protein